MSHQKGSNTILLYNEAQRQVASLAMDEKDAIFADSFENMVREAFTEGKLFFVAQIQSRQDQSTEAGVAAQNHSHFFNAYGILKLIFKKRGASGFVGRYHDTYPIHAKNPITNAVSLLKPNPFSSPRESLTKSSFTKLKSLPGLTPS